MEEEYCLMSSFNY